MVSPLFNVTAIPMFKYSEIFVPGGFPEHTYNPRVALKLEDKLKEVSENLCKLAIVTGHTKSGKTVLARKIFPKDNATWIDGGSIAVEDDFWQSIISRLELFQTKSALLQKEVGTMVGGKVGTEAGFVFVKGQGEFMSQLENKKQSGETSSRTTSSRITALLGLRDAKLPLVIDDFHYLKRDLQGSIVRALKPLIFDGLPVIIIAIPHRRYDAMKVEREMTGRISQIQIPVWERDELAFIPNRGFPMLNQVLSGTTRDLLTAQAIGSPHLIQEFCRAICKARKIEHIDQQAEVHLTDNELDPIFREVAESIGRPIFEKLARGPRQRSDRVPRSLKDGTTVDIYQLVLLALAHMKPGLDSLEYEHLRTAIKEVSAQDIPQLHEVARVLKHMATIAATDQ
ncbi:MAG: hypothetical protein ACXWJB_10760, partial [Limisphaerales bacterium]